MSKSKVITARIEPETWEQVDAVARAQGRSRSAFAADAIAEAAANEARILALVEEGIADVEAGRIHPHEVALAKIEALIAKHKARCPG